MAAGSGLLAIMGLPARVIGKLDTCVRCKAVPSQGGSRVVLGWSAEAAALRGVLGLDVVEECCSGVQPGR